MTGRRARLGKLEARRREDAGDTLGIFEADPAAGLWREVNGGRTLPLSPADLGDGDALAPVGLLIVSPLPGRSKIIPGLTWADL